VIGCERILWRYRKSPNIFCVCQGKTVRRTQETAMNQDKDVRIEPAELKQAMAGEFEQLVKETAEALNRARDGAIIADSEKIVHDAMARFREKVYEKAVQMKADKAAKAAFSPSAQRRGKDAKRQGPSGGPPFDDERDDSH